MVTRLRLCVLGASLCVLAAGSAHAQDAQEPAPPSPPANLAFIEGTVDVVQDGVTEPADPPIMLLAGDVVRTRNGRAEIVFGDGSLLHLADGSEIEILDADHLRLLAGRAMLRVSPSAARAYVVDTPMASIHLDPQGEYGVTSDRRTRIDVAVTRGSATIDESGSWTIRGGQMLTLTSGGRPLIQAFNSARWDAFAQWAHDRAHGFATASSSARLPYELRPYAPVFDGYGRWDHVAPHGYVWFPSVAAAWRPYFDGSWAFTRLGWTWHGRDRWAWPTHHYGRWGFTGASWYWIPARVWAPAWVSWSVAGGYVGWSPLGWDDRPAIPLRGRDHPAYRPDNSPWRGWTVVPREHFAPRRNARAHAVDGGRLDGPAQGALAAAIPILPSNDVAVPRSGPAEPRGLVRRPTRSYSSDDAAVTRGDARGGSTARPPRTYGSRARTSDDPAYAPPPGWDDGRDRRGSPRDAGEGRATGGDRPTRGTDGAARREGTRRSTPQTEPRPAPPSDGAVERGGRGQAPRAGAPAERGGRSGAGTGTGTGTGSNTGSPQGGARRRP